MKRLLLAGLAFSALIMPAMAADMPIKAPPPPPTWTGLYWGVNLGWIGSSQYDITNTGTDTGPAGLGSALALGVIPRIVAVSHSGFIGGGQIGYNWQIDPSWVWGIEADFQGTTATGSTGSVSLVGGPNFPDTLTTVYKYELDDLGTVRARVGWLSSPNAFTSVDYIPHHAWFQYFVSTRNPTHARPRSIAAIGTGYYGGMVPEPANHNYDILDFFTALKAGNLPAVSFLKAPAFQDGHAGYSDPLDEQTFLVNTINTLQRSSFWKSTAVVIMYDNSDGWYDHQMPPVVNPSFNPTVDILNGTGLCNSSNGFQQGRGPTPATPLNGTFAPGMWGRCGYGTRMPLLVVSPFAKKNFVDHTLTDQTSVLRFIEDNWLNGQRIQPGASFDTIAGTMENMFDFSRNDGGPTTGAQ